MTPLSELVATTDVVAATSSRTAKITALAELLRRLDPDEVLPAVCLLSGEPRQGRIGVGWARISAVTASPASAPSLTIDDLDRTLSEVRRTTGSGSTGSRTRLLADLLARATAEEGDFVRRLLTGELRQGALEGVMTEAVARAAGVPGATVRRAAMLSGDLGETASVALREGAAGLARVGLHPLRPVLPMLASTAETVAEALASTAKASVEWKFDGIRIQVHVDGDEVRVFTRNLNDVTDRLPEVVAVVRELPVRCVVLDGEAIALDADARPHAFQDIMSRVGRGTGELAMVPYFFDVLHVDGEDLIDRPLSDRLVALERVAGPWRIPAIVTRTPELAEGFLAQAIEAGHEGVVVKSMLSAYQAGRRGKLWRKVKPIKTLDLLVLGAEWGHGRRKGWLSNLHLGARDPSGGFVMVGKTFKGLTDELLRWQTTKLLELKEREEGITVFVRPELVVEIELDGVQVSTRYPGGVALRFARVKGYRPDKGPADVDFIDDVRALLGRVQGR